MSSHRRVRGFESIWRRGGSLFTCVVVFSHFVVVEGCFKGVCVCRQKRQRDRLGPTLHSLFTSSLLHTPAHPLIQHSFQPLQADCWDSIFPSPPEGSSVNKGRHVCFCLLCPQAIVALFTLNEGIPRLPVPSFNVPLSQLKLFCKEKYSKMPKDNSHGIYLCVMLVSYIMSRSWYIYNCMDSRFTDFSFKVSS